MWQNQSAVWRPWPYTSNSKHWCSRLLQPKFILYNPSLLCHPHTRSTLEKIKQIVLKAILKVKHFHPSQHYLPSQLSQSKVVCHLHLPGKVMQLPQITLKKKQKALIMWMQTRIMLIM
uniref:Uncharacterized protein n=1 Tax=Cacopsylla melanoneura TaxID=428564 RepID=A0A8D8M5T9_9HEMI